MPARMYVCTNFRYDICTTPPAERCTRKITAAADSIYHPVMCLHTRVPNIIIQYFLRLIVEYCLQVVRIAYILYVINGTYGQSVSRF